MSISIGDKALKECYIGSDKVKEIYVGSDKVWPTSLWSGTLTSHTPYGEICTIPDISSNTEITITLEYVSGTWNGGDVAYGQWLYYLKSSSSGLQMVDPPLSANNPKLTYTFKKSYNQSNNPFWLKCAPSWSGRDLCEIQIDFTTGVVSAGNQDTPEYSESSPVKVTINATNP